MTDLTKFPARPAGQVVAPGSPTVATSGLTFLHGLGLGPLAGRPGGRAAQGPGHPAALPQPRRPRWSPSARSARSASYGRIRTVQYGPDGALYFTTLERRRQRRGRPDQRLGHPADGATRGPTSRRSGSRPSARTATCTPSSAPAATGSTYKRSTDDGVTWPSGWTDTGLTSTSAPAVASSAPGGSTSSPATATGRVTHTWLVNGTRRGQTNLGGLMTTATVSSLGNGTLDVFALARERRRLPQAVQRQRLVGLAAPGRRTVHLARSAPRRSRPPSRP